MIFLHRATSATNLAMMRILMCLYLFLNLKLFRDVIFSQDSETLFRPIGIFRVLPHPVSIEWIWNIYYVWLFFSILALVGIFWRFVGPLWWALSLFILGYKNNFSNVGDGTQLYLLAAFLVAISPSTDRYSFDFLFRKITPRKNWDYAWPLVTMRLLVVYVMTLNGVQKLYLEGWDWIFSDKFYLTVFSNPVHTPYADFILGLPLWASQAIAFYIVIIVELLSPLALLSPLNWVYPFLWASLHIGVHFTFGGFRIFFSQIVVYLCFFNFQKFLERNSPNR